MGSRNMCRKYNYCCVFIVWCAVSPLTALAADFKLNADAAWSEIYTDNPGFGTNNENNGWITRLNGGIKARADGRRLGTDFMYRVDGQFQNHAGNLDDVRHQMRWRGRSELVKNWFFVNADIQHAQELETAQQPLSLDPSLRDGRALSDYAVYSVNPRLIHSFGGYTTVSASYLHLKRWQETGPESFLNSSELAMTSGKRFSRLRWGLRTSHIVMQASTGESIFDTALGDFSYALGNDFGVVGTLGHDNYTLGGAGDLQMDRWSAGITFKPSVRTRLELRREEVRRDGEPMDDNWRLDFTHSGAHTTVTAAYREEQVTTQLLQLSSVLRLGEVSPTGNVSLLTSSQNLSAGAQPVFLRGHLVNTSDAIYSLRRGDITVKYVLGELHALSAGLWGQRREYLNGGSLGLTGVEESQGVRLSWDWRATSLVRMGTNYEWYRIHARSTGQPIETSHIGVDASRRIGRYARAHIGYGYNTRHSDMAAERYIQNRIEAGLNISW